MKIEIYNSDYNVLGTYNMISFKDIEMFSTSEKKLGFVLRGFYKDNRQFLSFTSLIFKNVCDRYLKECENDKRFNMNNKYTITIEEV